MARALMGLGVGPGSHVGLLMPNCIEYVVLFHAIGLAGARALTINARYRAHELAHVLEHADVEILVIGGQALPHSDFRTLSGKRCRRWPVGMAGPASRCRRQKRCG